MTQINQPESTNSDNSELQSASYLPTKMWKLLPEKIRFGLTELWKWTGIREKKGVELLQLFMSVITPIVIPIVVWSATTSVQQSFNQQNQLVAEDNSRQAILSTYIDQISSLLIQQKIRNSQEEDESRTIARVRTLTAIRRLDSERNKNLTSFLQDAKLMQNNQSIISLEKAFLPEAHLRGADLRNANLNHALLYRADLQGADLRGADLSGANLSSANLYGAKLRGADLSKATLSYADLRTAYLQGANLSETWLFEADLSIAQLQGANMTSVYTASTDFRSANLSGASIGSNKINGYFCNTTMPDKSDNDSDCRKFWIPRDDSDPDDRALRTKSFSFTPDFDF